jgi:hypothetical protein
MLKLLKKGLGKIRKNNSFEVVEGSFDDFVQSELEPDNEIKSDNTPNDNIFNEFATGDTTNDNIFNEITLNKTDNFELLELVKNLNQILEANTMSVEEIIKIIKSSNQNDIGKTDQEGKTILHYYCSNSKAVDYLEIGTIIVDKMSKDNLKKVDIELNMGLYYCYQNKLEQIGDQIIQKLLI